MTHRSVAVLAVAFVFGLTALASADGWVLTEIDTDGQDGVHAKSPEDSSYINANHSESVGTTDAYCRFCTSLAFGENPDTPPDDPGWAHLTEGAVSTVTFTTDWDGDPEEKEDGEVEFNFNFHWDLRVFKNGSEADAEGLFIVEQHTPECREEEAQPKLILQADDDPEETHEELDHQAGYEFCWDTDDGDTWWAIVVEADSDADAAAIIGAYARVFCDKCRIDLEVQSLEK